MYMIIMITHSNADICHDAVTFGEADNILAHLDDSTNRFMTGDQLGSTLVSG